MMRRTMMGRPTLGRPMLGRATVLGIALALAGGLLAAAPAAPARAADISADSPKYGKNWRQCTRTLNGVRTTVGRYQRTAIVVNQKGRTYANTGFYVRVNGRQCDFQRLFLAKGSRLGYGGTVAGNKRKQGTGTTPRGTWRIKTAFGLKPNPGSWVPYHRVRPDDYWVQDNASRFYNTRRKKGAGGFRWWLPSSHKNSSERLADYPGQYDYALVIEYNRPPNAVRWRGAGIFLHVNGSGPTAGCISIDRDRMRTVLAYLKPGDRIVVAG